MIPTPPGDPIEAVWSEQGTATRIKSPAQHMHFTAGAPLRILADALDANAWVCPPGHPPYVCPGSAVRFYVDGQQVGTVPPSANDFNLWEWRLPNGLAQGDHVLTVSFVPYNQSTGGGGTPVNGLAPVTIHVDAAPAHGGTITLTLGTNLQSDHPSAVIDIADTGTGIPDAIRDRIFDSFLSGRPDGTGLGLAIAKRILLSHHGDIALVGSGPEGTTLRLTLPLAR